MYPEEGNISQGRAGEFWLGEDGRGRREERRKRYGDNPLDNGVD